MNNQGTNPVKLILGSQSVLSANTTILNNASLSTLMASAREARKILGKKIGKVVLLPFTNDGSKSIVKKRLLANFIFRSKATFIGFQLDKPSFISASQYTSYFDRLHISYAPSNKHNVSFLRDEGIEPSKRVNEKLQIAIYPNSKLEMKVWPKEKFLSVVNSLNEQLNADFFFIGGPEDGEYNDTLIAQLPGNISKHNIAGKYSIKETIQFLLSMDLLIANDGAPIHFASLVNVPVLGLYTYKEPVGSWDPVLASSFITYRVDVSCKNCFREHCPNPVCLTYVSEKEVLQAALQLLSQNEKTKEARVLFSKQPLSYLDANDTT